MRVDITAWSAVGFFKASPHLPKLSEADPDLVGTSLCEEVVLNSGGPGGLCVQFQ